MELDFSPDKVKAAADLLGDPDVLDAETADALRHYQDEAKKAGKWPRQGSTLVESFDAVPIPGATGKQKFDVQSSYAYDGTPSRGLSLEEGGDGSYTGPKEELMAQSQAPRNLEQEARYAAENAAYRGPEPDGSTAPPPKLDRPSTTSKGGFMSLRAFHELDDDGAKQALERPEVQHLVGFGPQAGLLSRPQKEQINDAVWALMYDKDEAEPAGARLVRARDLNNPAKVPEGTIGALGKFWIQNVQPVLDPVGELVLAFDRGMTGGLAQNALAMGAGALTGLDEPERLRDARLMPDTGTWDSIASGAQLPAEIAGALHPASLASRGARALGGAIGGLSGAARVAGAGAVGGAVAGGESLLQSGGDYLSGADPTLTGDQIGQRAAVNTLVGSAAGAALDPLAQLAQKGVARLRESTPGFTDIERAGGRVGVLAGAQLPPRLRNMFSRAATERAKYGGKPEIDAPLVNEAGDRTLRAVHSKRASRLAEAAKQNEELYAAAGDQTADTTPFINKLMQIAKRAEVPYVRDAKSAKALQGLVELRPVARHNNVPGHSADDISKAFGDDALPGARDPNVKYQVVPKRLNARQIDDMLDALGDDAAAASRDEASALSQTLREIQASGMSLRDQFASNPKMAQVAQRYGAKSYQELKRLQSDAIEAEGLFEGGLGLHGVKIPAGRSTMSPATQLESVPTIKPVSPDVLERRIALADRLENLMRDTPEGAIMSEHIVRRGEMGNKLARLGPEQFMNEYGGKALRAEQLKFKEIHKALKYAEDSGLTMEGPFYRGMVVPDDTLQSWIKNGVYKNRVVTSASVDPELAVGYARSRAGDDGKKVVLHFDESTQAVPLPTGKTDSEVWRSGFNREVLLPPEKSFGVQHYGTDAEGVTHLYLSADKRWSMPLDKNLMDLIPANNAKALRGVLRSRPEESQRAFQLVEKLDPRSAQLFADILGIEAKKVADKGGDIGVSSGGNPYIGGAMGFLKPRSFAAMQAVSNGIPEGINWDGLWKALKGAPNRDALIDFLTDTPKAAGAFAPAKGWVALGKGAPGRAINMDNLHALVEMANLGLDSAKEGAQSTVQDAKGTVRDTLKEVVPVSPAQQRQQEEYAPQ